VGSRGKLLAATRCVIAGLSIALLMACDPPRDLTQQGLTSDTVSATQEAGAQTGQAAAKAGKVPVSGAVVLIGGWGKGNKATATAEFYDPSKGKFTRTGSMAVGAGMLSGALLDSGDILVAGGFGGKSKFLKKTVGQTITGSATNNLQTLDSGSGAFTAVNSTLMTARFGATATTLGNGKVLIAGGAGSNGTPTNTAELYDPSAGTTSATGNNMSSPRAFHTATLLGDGTVLLAGGGIDNIGDLTATADIYDPATNIFSSTGQMSVGRGAHAAVLLTDGPLAGQVLIAGGAVGSSTGLASISTAESYDPVGKTFSFLGSTMNDARAFHTATVLSNGDVLISGGFSNFFGATFNGANGSMAGLFGSNLSSAEIYDHTTGIFSCVGGTNGTGGGVCSAAMKLGRGGHSATLFTSGPLAGQVLIAGGLGAKKPNSKAKELKEAELFNPTGNTFTKTGNLKAARGLHVAILLP
jgi:Galactose oxidase, central domain